VAQSSQTPPLSSLFSFSNNNHGNNRSSKDSHISVNAERRFFDQAKDVLYSISKEVWHEFVKCLDWFSNDIISKNDMIDMIGDLFGPANNELLTEFKRLLSNRADYDAHKEDIWYAVPLSEIDFSQCVKCSPSYRALPKDYPKPKCTERSQEEDKVLNDDV
jgi:paired amphipathic helix protein Sin3a